MDEISTIQNRIDELEVAMEEHPLKKECEVEHTFFGGIYSRTIFMKAGDRVVSMIHKFDHHYCILEGVCSVFIDGNWELLYAPFRGLTKAGTRRILWIHMDCTWTTYHKTDIIPNDDSEEAKLRAVELVREEIIEKNQRVIELKNKRRQLCPGQQLQ